MSCYAGQFGAYEGRTLNFTEFVYSAGGEILNSDHDLVINSNASHTGLQNMVDLFKLGIAPKESITWTESDGLQAFSNGKLLFLRSWPYMYDAVIQESLPGTVGVTALPGIPSIATINLYVSSRTKHKDTALDFMRYSIGGESQSIVYRDSRVPSQASFYNDRNLLAKDPLLATIRDSLLVAKPRASFTRYSEASALIQKEVGLALTGVQSVELTISHLNLKLVEFI
jgi:multiple sugar transport system substrate-binding protein